MTVREHLELYGFIKGFNKEDTDQNIEYFLEILQLKDHQDKRTDILSGGNKRRLCVAIALIGSPSILFLDEPSTGLDPIAKKCLWHSLNQSLQLKKASITFTTHSIAEAEALCHKIGIMVNGKFMCLGSTQYLKNKYGNGYKITLKKLGNNTNTIEIIEECFGKNIATLIGTNGDNDTYQVIIIIIIYFISL